MRTPTPGPTTSRDPLLESWAISSDVQPLLLLLLLRGHLVNAEILSTQVVCFTSKETSPMI
jgi:hypothetical protein